MNKKASKDAFLLLNNPSSPILVMFSLADSHAKITQ